MPISELMESEKKDGIERLIFACQNYLNFQTMPLLFVFYFNLKNLKNHQESGLEKMGSAVNKQIAKQVGSVFCRIFITLNKCIQLSQDIILPHCGAKHEQLTRVFTHFSGQNTYRMLVYGNAIL